MTIGAHVILSAAKNLPVFWNVLNEKSAGKRNVRGDIACRAGSTGKA